MSDRAQNIKELIGEKRTREFSIRAADINSDERSVELAFSSETPVDRWYGTEILSHEPGAIRMTRLTDGAPLLNQHDPHQQIGVVASARIDADSVGRAVVRFSRGAHAEEIFRDVQDGIRTKVSVGYIVHDLKLESSGDDGDTYRVTDWEPIELSSVSIPADNAVGVGRDLPQQPEASKMPEATTTPAGNSPEIEPTPNMSTEETREIPAAPALESAAGPDDDAILNPDATAIRAVAAHFGLRDLAEKEIVMGSSLESFRELVRKQQPDPVPSAPRIQTRIPHAGNLRAFTPEIYGSRKDAEEQAYRAGQWARATLFGNSDSARWCRDYGVQMDKRVMTGIAGGQSVVVPDELVLPIIALREQYGIARRVCYVHPMSSDTATVPRRTSGVSAYFVGRESAPTAGDPGMDDVSLTARNLATETRISNDYADDSAINLADMLAEEQTLAFVTKEDACLFNGDGTSTYGGIVGLRTLLNAANSRAGAVDAASGHDTFAEITAADLRSVMGVLPDYPGINPAWFVSKPGSEGIFGRLKDAAGGNTKVDLSAGEVPTYAGYDILTSPAMPTSTGDLSDVAVALFGDLRMGVVFGDRRGMTMMVDPYSLSSYQQTKIIGSERFDINCHGVGDTSDAGPVVALVGE